MGMFYYRCRSRDRCGYYDTYFMTAGSSKSRKTRADPDNPDCRKILSHLDSPAVSNASICLSVSILAVRDGRRGTKREPTYPPALIQAVHKGTTSGVWVDHVNYNLL